MRRLLAPAAAVCALAAVAWFALRLLAPGPSDEERIRALFEDAARAAEEKRIGDVVKDVSERYAGEGLDRRGLKQLVAGHVLRGTWVSVSISALELSVEGDAATATVDVLLARSGQGRPIEQLLPADATLNRIACRLEREREGWKVVSAERRRIGVDEALAGPGSAR